jgi:hypothetical protein
VRPGATAWEELRTSRLQPLSRRTRKQRQSSARRRKIGAALGAPTNRICAPELVRAEALPSAQNGRTGSPPESSNGPGLSRAASMTGFAAPDYLAADAASGSGRLGRGQLVHAAEPTQLARRSGVAG